MPIVLLADDHVIVRRGLRNLLAEHFRPSQVEEVSSCACLLARLQQHPYDLLILDLQLSDGNAFELVEGIRTGHPRMRVLVYTTSPEKLYAERVMELGGSGFVTKQANEDEVLLALRMVMQGRIYRSHEQQVRALHQQDHLRKDPTDPFSVLSDRELGVMHEILAGRGVKEIAERLGLQPTTAATYKARLFDKLGVSNILELQHFVAFHGTAR